MTAGTSSEQDSTVSLTSRDAWRWLFSLAWPERRRLGISLVSLTLSSGVALAVPMVAGWVVDAALTERDMARFDVVILGIIGLFALNGAFDFLETYMLRAAAASMLQSLRARLHAHLLSLSPGFFEGQRTGDLLSRLGTDVDQIGSVLTNDVVGGVNRVLVLVGSLVLLLTVHTGLTGVMLVAVPPVMIAAVVFGRRFEKLSKERQEMTAKAGVVAEESLGGVRTVQSFGREAAERERYDDMLGRVTQTALRAALAWGGFTGVVSFLAFTAFSLVIWYGGRLIAEKTLSPGQVAAFLLYSGSIAGSVAALTALYGSLRSALGATERVREILDTRPAIEDPVDPVPLAVSRAPAPEVELVDVSFRYATQERQALRGVSLRTPPGDVTALVGPSGAGKSTLISLLLRFYDVASGEVRVAGADVRRVRVADLRAAIGLVPQDIFLFGGTVAENIRYGSPQPGGSGGGFLLPGRRVGASDDDVRRAAAAAQAHAFIERLPKGYETEVGERGVRLSTGERQRIAIARVFLKDPPILILDEATSSLDAESEHQVQQALERLMAGRTTIVIAHRLSTVRRARQVVLLEDGRAADRGTHEELFEKSPKYRRLCELQLIGPEAGGEGDGVPGPGTTEPPKTPSTPKGTPRASDAHPRSS